MKNKELIRKQVYCLGIYEIRQLPVGVLESKKGPVFVLRNITSIFLLTYSLNNVTPFSNCTYFFLT
jgi:hypothetical protein